MFKRPPYILALLLFCSLVNLKAEVDVIDHGASMTLQTEYGEYQINEQVILDLIRCPAFERLKHIYQYGVSRYARQEKKFTRYEHCIGVFVLLRHFGASIAEQIDGLLHDVSHTVFSHVGDYVFNHYFDKYSYQDDMHEWFLNKMGVDVILKKHGYEHACASHMKAKHRMLEQDKPNLCMDRIEYLLRGGLVDNILEQEEVMPILQDLYFENQLWIFKHADKARKLADISLRLTENIFAAAWNAFVYTHASKALLRAVELKIITLEDIHFSTDEIIWQKLHDSADKMIIDSLDKVKNYKNYFIISDQTSYDQHFKVKSLAVNPWVETHDGLKRLTEIDQEYAGEYNRINSMAKNGWYIKLLK